MTQLETRRRIGLLIAAVRREDLDALEALLRGWLRVLDEEVDEAYEEEHGWGLEEEC
jgi:hypothetical protein